MNNPAELFNGNTASMFFAPMHHKDVESSTRWLAKKSINRRI